MKDKDVVTTPAYLWIGHNRTKLSKKAVRGSGGVGVLVKESLLYNYTLIIVIKASYGCLSTILTILTPVIPSVFVSVICHSQALAVETHL